VLDEEADKPYIRIRGTRLGGKYKVANVPVPDHDGAADWMRDESRADARLIAAAPELLEALERCLSWLTSYPGGGTMGPKGPYEQARAAITRATEGQG
jgi:hypothetical protein